jgi:DNA-binding HxlR family transcriptional regulator
VRSYHQYCAIAKSLDVIGDRWNLLIVRELLLQGPSRYTDLQQGLPGIATNLLADRLRDLESQGIIAREEAPPPIATTLFRLTARGEDLRAVIYELGRWGAPLMTEPDEQDVYRDHWLALPVRLFVNDRTPDEPPVTIELRAGGQPITVETREGKVHTRPGAAENPDLILTGAPQQVVGVLTGQLSLTAARAHGLRTQGNAKVLARLQPEAVGAHVA